MIPVVGDAEDYYVTSKVLSLGLRPLIVAVNDYYKNDIGWHNLHNLITYFDVDSIVYNLIYQLIKSSFVQVYENIITCYSHSYNYTRAFGTYSSAKTHSAYYLGTKPVIGTSRKIFSL